MKIGAIVLAAGQGKRLRTENCDLPKVLRNANGRSLLSYVLESISFIPPEDTVIVVGYKREDVEKVTKGYVHAVQSEQLGTGHAVMQAGDWLVEMARQKGQVLLCYGDMPLIRRATYEGMVKHHLETGASCTLLSYNTPLNLAYGRILRMADGSFDRIIEDRDCNSEQKKIHEYNAGVYVFDAECLLEGLKHINNNNNQNEYYVTDVPQYIKNTGKKLEIFESSGEYEGLGVNTQEDLQMVEKLLEVEKCQ